MTTPVANTKSAKSKTKPVYPAPASTSVPPGKVTKSTLATPRKARRPAAGARPNVTSMNRPFQENQAELTAAMALLYNATYTPIEIHKAFKAATETMSMAERQDAALRMHHIASGLAQDQGVLPTSMPLVIPAANERAMEKLVAEARTARAQHLAEGRLLPAAEFQQALAVTKQAVSNAVLQHRMFYLTGPSGEHLYPTFFTEDRYHRKDLYKVSKRLGNMPGGNKWQFFTKGKGSLEGKTPLDALAEGRLDDVLIAAAGFAER